MTRMIWYISGMKENITPAVNGVSEAASEKTLVAVGT